jgi:colicin import membrane protein
MVMDAPPQPPAKVIPQPQHVIPKPMSPTPPTPPTPQPAKPTLPEPVKEVVQPKPLEKPQITQPKKDAIAISDKKQKKREQDKIAKQLLSDIKQQANKEKKVKEKAKERALAAAFEKEMKQLKTKSIQRQMLQEQKQLAGARSQKMQGEVNKYKALILQAISQNWIVPGSVDKSLYAQLLIRVAPGGVVLDVQVVKSSGDESLDRSVRAAVFKSSPLPVPHDAEAFDEFRQFVLKVKPENILSPDSWSS